MQASQSLLVMRSWNVKNKFETTITLSRSCRLISLWRCLFASRLAAALVPGRQGRGTRLGEQHFVPKCFQILVFSKILPLDLEEAAHRRSVDFIRLALGTTLRLEPRCFGLLGSGDRSDTSPFAGLRAREE